MPVTIAAPPANISIVGLNENAISGPSSAGMIDAIRSSVHFATTRPAIAPNAASRIDSVSSCVINCRRFAPIDRRTAISAARPAPRTSSRLAMFAQAISSTVPVTREQDDQRRARFVVEAALPALARSRS